MKLTAIEKKVIPIQTRGRTEEYRELLTEFAESDMESARIDELDGQVDSIYSGLKRVVESGHFHIRVVKANKEVYLIKI